MATKRKTTERAVVEEARGLSEAARASLEGAAAEFVTLDRLQPWKDNPRRNEAAVPEVRNSIARFGFGAPLIARKADGMIIAGHTRFEAAKQLGLDRVPVRFLDLSAAEAQALALADNRLGELALWSDNLGAVLAQLSAEEVDLSGLGWEVGELNGLIEGTPDFIGGDRISNDVARTNNNMNKIGTEATARISYAKGARRDRPDLTRGLLRYMLRHRHTSPFEMVEIKVRVKLPIFVERQWVRWFG